MDVNLTTSWQAVAEGEGPVTFEALNRNVRWWVATSAPTTTGLSAEPDKPTSLQLESGEVLYLRGSGTAVVLTANPVT
ncbi:hypothetical protein [Roseinatronobacter sp. NSM]|uniref:hypothetical protein n=1 Tax=Roseinatronobacter sp. NSM TaxID=3457785 RepID=UPI0040353EE2